MPIRKKKFDPAKQAEILAEVRRSREQRQQTYRERALALFPHVCARCGRDFDAKNLRELTVHHKDSDHMNNPPDGSNWELLCTYCHGDEHYEYQRAGNTATPTRHSDTGASEGFRPFEGLVGLLGNKEETSR